jgi:hypothetical protein
LQLRRAPSAPRLLGVLFFERTLPEREPEKLQRKLGAVAGFVKLFAKERRNDFSAAAIAAAMNGHYPVEDVVAVLEELKASGDYDRIIAETSAG